MAGRAARQVFLWARHYFVAMKSVCSVFCGVSLDGFIARPDGGLDWLEGDGSAEAGDHGYEAFMTTIDAIVMGRNTFDVVMSFPKWPYTKKVIVLSGGTVDLTGARARGADVEVMNAPPRELVAQLADKGLFRLYIDGGVTIQRFLRAGLIDRLILSRLPVLIGQGVPLFGSLDHDIRLKLIASRTFPGGMVQCEYAR
jgi:dihydrofolate reductase